MSDDWIHSAKQSSYHGRAKVMLGHFDLSDTSGTRTIREEHINSLVRVFESEGCMRSSPDNYVKVIVERNLLQQCLTGQGLSEAHLHGELQFLDFPSDFQLTLLHGKHRLLAAERFLWDKWWVAEFYSEGKPGNCFLYYSLTYLLQIFPKTYDSSFMKSTQTLSDFLMEISTKIYGSLRRKGMLTLKLNGAEGSRVV